MTYLSGTNCVRFVAFWSLTPGEAFCYDNLYLMKIDVSNKVAKDFGNCVELSNGKVSSLDENKMVIPVSAGVAFSRKGDQDND